MSEITVCKGGMLALNESALKMLGDEMAFIQRGYYETKKAINLRAAGQGSTGRYQRRRQTKSQTRLVDGKRLLALYGLSVEKAHVLLRPTASYGALLLESFHPHLLAYALEHQRFLDRLSDDEYCR